MNDSNSNNIKTDRVLAVLVAILVVFALGIIIFYSYNFNSDILKNGNWIGIFQNLSKDTGDWGTFGDYVGGILNPVIAAFAFYLIKETYISQKKELKETRELLKDSTELAALTALLNSNFTRISLLESEKLLLLESELRNPPPKKEINANELLMKAYQGKYSAYSERIKGRKDYIKDEIDALKNKNTELEAQIENFLKK